MKKKTGISNKNTLSGQAGQALILVLIFLLLGSLILVPALARIGTSLKTNVAYENKSSELSTADSGIEEGMWRIKYDFMGPDYDPYDFDTSYTYDVNDVNSLDAVVTIENIWVPSDVTLSSLSINSTEAKSIIESEKLVITGTAGVVPGNPYHIKLDFIPDEGDNLTIKSIGVWLPQGFTYDGDNPCDLEELDEFDPCHPDHVVDTIVSGGRTIVWSYDSPYPLFTSFPGVNPGAETMTLDVEFNYVAETPGTIPVGITWVTTDMDPTCLNVNDVPIVWDTDTRIYKITSESGQTRIEAYSSKNQLRNLGSAIGGDYIAIGNSLLADDNDDNYRETWHTPSSFDVDDPADAVEIPEDADVVAAYLYWSGWRNDAAKQNLLNDSCDDFSNWDRSSDDLNQIRYPTGDLSSSGAWNPSSDMYTYVDEEGTDDGDATYLLHGTTSGSALFTFPAFDVLSSSVIQNLTVTLVAKDNTTGTNRMQPAIRVGGTNYLNTSTSTSVESGYTAISYVYTTNPRTSSAWTAEDINGTSANPLQAFGVYSADANPEIRLTQVYAQVNYCESRWSIYSGRFRGYGTASATTAQRTLTLKNSLDLSSYAPTTVVVYWEPTVGGGLDSADALYFAFSGNGGATWGDYVEAFHDDSPTPTNPYWYPVDAKFFTNNFKMRLYFNFNDTAEYVNLDNIKIIYMAPDTDVIFKINNEQVYFDGSLPASGSYPIIAGRSYAMFNSMWGTPEGYSYACTRDVTALVKKYPVVEGEEHHNGSTIYTIDDVTADIYKSGTTKSNFAFAGWSLIIVYSSPATAGHYIYLNDDNFAFHPGTGGNLDFDNDPSYPGGVITNFVFPNAITDKFGTILETTAAKLTCFIVEGDDFGTSSITITGQQSGLSATLYNIKSPVTDVWNGQSYPGTFNEGVDIDTFTIDWDDGIFMPKDTILYVDLLANSDAWNLVYFIISIRSETVTSGTGHYTIYGN